MRGIHALLEPGNSAEECRSFVELKHPIGSVRFFGGRVLCPRPPVLKDALADIDRRYLSLHFADRMLNRQIPKLAVITADDIKYVVVRQMFIVLYPKQTDNNSLNYVLDTFVVGSDSRAVIKW